MWQILITGLIVAAALGIAAVRIVRFFSPDERANHGCGTGCTACRLGEEIRKKSQGQGT